MFDKDDKPMYPRLMWKAGDDLRRDLLVEIFFEIFNLIWSKTLGEEVFEKQITYGVLPLIGTARLGFLEFVEDAESQAVFDWQRTDPELWMPSFAASMTAAYCLGVEDRHARNILIKNGSVFQIDFGYILGEQPGLGLGAGPALPFSKDVSRALTADQRTRFIEYSCLLFDILARYRAELSGLAARFCEVMRLSVLLTNPRSFMEKRLASTVLFRHEISRAERDVGRMRKEYLALAWVRRCLLFFFIFLISPLLFHLITCAGKQNLLSSGISRVRGKVKHANRQRRFGTHRSRAFAQSSPAQIGCSGGAFEAEAHYNPPSPRSQEQNLQLAPFQQKRRRGKSTEQRVMKPQK